MKITVESVGLTLTEALQTYIEKKFLSLGKFVARFEKESELWVRVEVRRTTRHHRKGEVYQVVADIRFPKKVVRAGESGDDLRATVDRTKDTLKMEIEKYKAKVAGTGAKREGK